MSKGSVPWPSLNALEAVMPAVGADPAHPRGQSVEKLSPRETIVRAVIRGLYEGRYEPGQRLLESELTAAFGVSRGPVREALNRLAAMGAIELTLQRGAQVRVLTIDQAIDILVVVQALIGTAARLAASRIGAPGAAAHMRAALEAVETFDPADRSAEYAIARDGFYRALTSIANNSELTRILPAAQIHLIRIQFRAALRSGERRRHADYRNIACAILSGRASAAETAARAHLGRLAKALLRLRERSRTC